jgi:hypothetical protein
MNNIVRFSASVNPDDDLDTHAAEIRKGIQEMQTQMRNALRICFKVGGHLILAKQQVAHGEWKRWLKENCFLSQRTAQLYMQLADNQELIEDELVMTPELGVRAAAKLIAKPSTKPEAKESDAAEPNQEEPGESAPAADHAEFLLRVWQTTPVAVRKAVLTSLTIPALLELLSKEQIAELKQRWRGNDKAQKKRARKDKQRGKKPAPFLELQATRLT